MKQYELNAHLEEIVEDEEEVPIVGHGKVKDLILPILFFDRFLYWIYVVHRRLFSKGFRLQRPLLIAPVREVWY